MMLRATKQSATYHTQLQLATKMDDDRVAQNSKTAATNTPVAAAAQQP